MESYTILKMMWKKQRLGLWCLRMAEKNTSPFTILQNHRWIDASFAKSLGWGFPEEDSHTVSFSGSLGILLYDPERSQKKRCTTQKTVFQYHKVFQYFFQKSSIFSSIFFHPLIFQFVLNLSREPRQEVACMSRMLLCWRLLAAATWMRNKNGVSIGNLKKRQGIRS